MCKSDFKKTSKISEKNKFQRDFWVLEYDSETNRQSIEWHIANHQTQKALLSKLNMLICVFDRNYRFKELMLQGQTVSKHFLSEKLQKRVFRVRLKIKNNLVMHHDNAPCHSAISINELLTSKSRFPNSLFIRL